MRVSGLSLSRVPRFAVQLQAVREAQASEPRHVGGKALQVRVEPGHPFLSVQGFMVSAFSKNPQLAQAFLKEWVAAEDTQTALYAAGQRPPALLSAQRRISDPYIAQLAVGGAAGEPLPGIAAMSAVWSSWGDAITLAMQDPYSDASNLAAQAAEMIREYIGQNTFAE